MSAGLTTVLQDPWVLLLIGGIWTVKISLEGDGAAVVATVEATSNTNGGVFVTVAGIDGRWQINDLGEGPIRAQDHRPGLSRIVNTGYRRG